MLICNKCGSLIGDEEIKKYIEPHGELRYFYDCECGGEYVEARRCRGCGEWFEDTHNHFVCEGCLEEEMTLDNAVKFGKENSWEIKLNGFLIYMLGEEGIERILTDYLKSLNFSEEIKDYCREDKGAFADFVLGLYEERRKSAYIRPSANPSALTAEEIQEIAPSPTVNNDYLSGFETIL